jgi:YfiR/HmsC-like
MALNATGLIRTLGCVAGLVAASAAGPVPAQTPAHAQAAAAAAPEYQVKAVFLFHFAQFVSWPAGAFADSAAPLVIGILGQDPFGAFLDETVRGEAIEGHPLVVRRFDRVEEIAGCHILFVSRDVMPQMPAILQALTGRNVLTVSDVPGFASQGGMIRFVTDRNRIRLRINLEAARAADLTLSSKLLRPAEIIRSGQD